MIFLLCLLAVFQLGQLVAFCPTRPFCPSRTTATRPWAAAFSNDRTPPGSSSILRPPSRTVDQSIVGTQSVANVPFFPRSLEELADDAAFSAKIVHMSNHRRIRIDVTTFLTRRERHKVEFMLLLARALVDEATPHVHVFVDPSLSLGRVEAQWVDMCAGFAAQGATATGMTPTPAGQPPTTAERDTFHREFSKLTISAMGDRFLQDIVPEGKRAAKARERVEQSGNNSSSSRSSSAFAVAGKPDKPSPSPRRPQPSAFVLLQPSNLFASGPDPPDPAANPLEEVQALAFHAALRGIPVVLINPLLVTTSCELGARDPLLLGDFCQAYFVHDHYLMMAKRGQFCGLLQRAATGFDLFLLEGLWNGACSSYQRIASWPEGFPSNLRSSIAAALLRQAGPVGGPRGQAQQQNQQNRQEDVFIEAFRRQREEGLRVGAGVVFGPRGGESLGKKGVIRLNDDFLREKSGEGEGSA